MARFIINSKMFDYLSITVIILNSILLASVDPTAA